MEVRKVETDQDPGGIEREVSKSAGWEGFLERRTLFLWEGKEGEGGQVKRWQQTFQEGGRKLMELRQKNLTPHLCKERGKVGISKMFQILTIFDTQKPCFSVKINWCQSAYLMKI